MFNTFIHMLYLSTYLPIKQQDRQVLIMSADYDNMGTRHNGKTEGGVAGGVGQCVAGTVRISEKSAP
jgi:hypothetical protein